VGVSFDKAEATETSGCLRVLRDGDELEYAIRQIRRGTDFLAEWESIEREAAEVDAACGPACNGATSRRRSGRWRPPKLGTWST
jgi:hypothetical protein